MTTEQNRLLFLVASILDDLTEVLKKINTGQTAGVEKRLKRLKKETLSVACDAEDLLDT